MPLSNFINLADPRSIDKQLRDLKSKYLPNKSWLGDKNKFSKDTINRIKETILAIPVASHQKIQRKGLAEYIAASTILHCLDGWSHFSCGVESLLCGDMGTSIHMVYYAELRAVMSLLAREGIAVFNTQHFILDSLDKLRLVNGPGIRNRTHEFVSDAILAWAKDPKNSQTLFESIKVRGHSISEWFTALGKASGSAVASKIAADWLKSWSLDLTYISGDHILRNEMSYRPHELSFDSNTRFFLAALKKTIDLWRICEPSGGGKSSERFSVLDAHLLRIAMETMYRSMGRKLRNRKMSENFVERTFGNLGLSKTDSLFKFLLRDTVPNDIAIFKDATHLSMRPKRGSTNYYRIHQFYSLEDILAVMSRSLLLLRFSTALASTLLDKANISRIDIDFWLDNIGENLGYWDATTKPTDFVDLWAAVNSSLQAIEAELTRTAVNSLALANNNAISGDLPKVGQFQRAYLWGIGV